MLNLVIFVYPRPAPALALAPATFTRPRTRESRPATFRHTRLFHIKHFFVYIRRSLYLSVFKSWSAACLVWSCNNISYHAINDNFNQF